MHNAQFPSEVDSIEKALSAIDVAYHMNYRNGEIGHYSFESTGASSAKMVCNNPYPTEFDHGIIEAMAGKFEEMIDVSLDTSAKSRKSGGSSDTYIINW